MKPEKDDTEFQHPYFIRGQEHLLENIKRKVTSVSFCHGSFGKGSDKLFENKALVGTASGCPGGEVLAAALLAASALAQLPAAAPPC